MNTPTVKVNPSKAEKWFSNFHKVKEFYEKHGHTALPTKDPEYKRLSGWLTYQRHKARRLRKQQRELLESIKYKVVAMRNVENDAQAWDSRYKELQKVLEETGVLILTVKQHSLSCWLSQQKKLWKQAKLDPERRDKLAKLGVEIETMVKPRKNPERIKELNEKWQQRYEQLKEYKRRNGHCNVPRCWNEDPSLGSWVDSQRTNYRHKQAGIDDMDPTRIKLLEDIGFNWSVRKPAPNQG